MTARPRPVRARAVALVLGALVLLGACSSQQSIPDSYGDTTRRNFTEGCEQTLTDDAGEDEAYSADIARNTCVCIYEGIVDGQDDIDPVPFDEFKELNEELSDNPGPLPDAIAEHARACQRSEAALR